MPERIASYILKNTKGKEPYRLFNLDHFNDRHENISLYGTIPTILARKSGSSFCCGAFLCNASDGYVDIEGEEERKATFIMEAGDLDLYFFSAENPVELFEQQSSLLGKPLLPPRHALGYHQCRWNYMSQAEVKEVNQKLEDYGIPCDYIWLDIEYSDHKAYFTWNKEQFPKPEEMVEKLWDKGRRLVTIIDPHIRRDEEYEIYKDHLERNIAVRNKDGEVYESWCWPGHSVWTDFMNPEASEYIS